MKTVLQIASKVHAHMEMEIGSQPASQSYNNMLDMLQANVNVCMVWAYILYVQVEVNASSHSLLALSILCT